MVIALIGGRCCGKSALAKAICEKVHATVYTGRGYQELATDELVARERFRRLLAEAQEADEYVIYLVTEKEQQELLPLGCLRVLCKATLKTVKARFAAQMGEPLTPAMSAMLEKQHGNFDSCPHMMALDPTGGDIDLLAVEILEQVGL